jgi:signal transduction histidine kinase
VRLRLAGTVAAATITVVLAFCVPLALVIRVVARDRAIHGAQLESRSLAAVLTGTRDPAVLNPIVVQANADSPRPATVFLPDGTTIGDPRPAGPELGTARAGHAFTMSGSNGETVLLPVETSDGTAVVRVFIPGSQLMRGVYTAWAVLGLLALGLIALATLIADRLGRSLVRPMRNLRDVALRLQHGESSARASLDGPAEVVEVARALNGLADRIDVLLAAEREAAADLSHRLRTPMTALRLDVDRLAPGSDRDQLLQELKALERSVDDLIRSARATTDASRLSRVDVSHAVRARMAFWDVLARNQSRPVTVDVADGPLVANVSPADLDAAIDVLAGNVFAHTPDGTPFRVAVRASNDGRSVDLVVDDDGPGVRDPGAVERGVSGAGSTGLGLDIVRRTAERSGGRFRLSSGATGGLRAELRLPVAHTVRADASSSAGPINRR